MSSSGPGLPRPSRLLVVNHSEPSGARTTSRSRPNSPVKWATGAADRAGVIQRDLPQPHPAQRGDPEAAGRYRGARRRCLLGRPGELGIGVRRVVAGSLDDRPAVVVPLPDPVDFVEAVLAELGGVHPPVAVPRDPLHVAVPVGPHQRAERVARSGPAVRRHPEDLAAQGIPVLGNTGFGVLAGGRPQHAVWSEGQPSAVVDGGARNPGEHGFELHPRLADSALRVAEPRDPVVRGRAEVQVDQPVPAERRGHRHAEQAALTGGFHPRDRADRADPALRGHPEQPGAVALGHQCVAIRQEGDRPRHLQVPHQHGWLSGRRRGLRGPARHGPARCGPATRVRGPAAARTQQARTQ